MPTEYVIGTLSALSNFSNIFTFILNNNNDNFIIENNILKSNIVFDYSEQQQYSINVTVIDENDLSYSKNLIIDILKLGNLNDIILTRNYIIENEPSNTYIGNFITTYLINNFRSNNNLTYTLYGINKNLFNIVNSTLNSSVSFDYEDKNVYTITVLSSDGEENIIKDFNIYILDLLESEPESESEPGPESESETGPESESETGPESESELEPESEPEIEPEAEPEFIECLDQYDDNTIQMVNPYTFNYIPFSDNVKIGVNIGIYTLKGATHKHPIGFVINNTDLFEIINGKLYGVRNVEGINVVHYTGTIIFSVKGNFGNISYHCYNHGYMGGYKKLYFSEACPKKPIPESEPEPEPEPCEDNSFTIYDTSIQSRFYHLINNSNSNILRINNKNNKISNPKDEISDKVNNEINSEINSEINNDTNNDTNNYINNNTNINNKLSNNCNCKGKK